MKEYLLLISLRSTPLYSKILEKYACRRQSKTERNLSITTMEDMLFYDRLQFAFTITFHYIFPQLTMGLSLMIVYFKGNYLRNKVEKYNDAAKFFMKIFAINFTMGVITGIPMEFQFGTNCTRHCELSKYIVSECIMSNDVLIGIF